MWLNLDDLDAVFVCVHLKKWLRSVCSFCSVRPASISAQETYWVLSQSTSSTVCTYSSRKLPPLSKLTCLSIDFFCGKRRSQNSRSKVDDEDVSYDTWELLTGLPLGMNISELLNIQKRDRPSLGPSYKNSWPSPLPHFPQQTWKVLIQRVQIKTLHRSRLRTATGLTEISSSQAYSAVLLLQR